MSEYFSDYVAKVTANLNQHIETFAAAWLQKTGANPTECVMCWQLEQRGNFRIWFEPFPTESDIEMYRRRAELAEKQLAELKDKLRWIPFDEHRPQQMSQPPGPELIKRTSAADDRIIYACDECIQGKDVLEYTAYPGLEVFWCGICGIRPANHILPNDDYNRKLLGLAEKKQP